MYVDVLVQNSRRGRHGRLRWILTVVITLANLAGQWAEGGPGSIDRPDTQKLEELSQLKLLAFGHVGGACTRNLFSYVPLYSAGI
jgi:hypothetical protein